VKQDQNFLTLKEVAAMYRVSRQSVWYWARSGKLKALRIGKQYRIYPSDLKKFIR